MEKRKFRASLILYIVESGESSIVMSRSSVQVIKEFLLSSKSDQAVVVGDQASSHAPGVRIRIVNIVSRLGGETVQLEDLEL